jgi:hypothetical protein
MSMDPELSHALTQLLVAIVTAITGVVGLWVASKMPGPVRDALTSGTHARDMALLVATMARRATSEIADHRTPPPTSAEIVAYSERVRGDLMAKMDINAEGLTTMANAAIANATVVPVVAALAEVLAPVVLPPATAPPA